MYDWLSLYTWGHKDESRCSFNLSLAQCLSYCIRSLSSVNNWRTAALGAFIFKEFTSRYIVYCVMSDRISRHGVLLLYCMGP